ncbi:hypothetical protein [Nostoc sp.]
MTLAIIREFKFPADKRFHVKLTPMDFEALQIVWLQQNVSEMGL